jgi:lactoylglutathione lyase
MTILEIDTVAVVVSDPPSAIGWYRDVLGLEVAYIGPESPSPDPAVQGTPERPGHWVEMGPRRPKTRIHLCHLDGRTEPGPTGITVLTDDILAEYRRMRDRGVRFLSEPQQMEWGEWLCAFVDPDGNEFDLKQPSAPPRTTSDP